MRLTIGEHERKGVWCTWRLFAVENDSRRALNAARNAEEEAPRCSPRAARVGRVEAAIETQLRTGHFLDGRAIGRLATSVSYLSFVSFGGRRMAEPEQGECLS